MSAASAGLLIGGEEVEALDGERFDTFDPSSGELIGTVANAGPADVDRAVSTAAEAFEQVRSSTPPRLRVEWLRGAAAAIRADADRLTEIAVRTAGLPRSLASGDVQTAARYFDYYAGLADKLHGESIPLGPEFVDYTAREPWGVCAIIPPFNVPFQITARSLAPALATGNAVVVKPAEQDPLPALELGRMLIRAGAPAGLVNVVPGLGAQTGKALVANADVAHVTFTGSVEVGREVMRLAADQLTHVTLELGGKSPQIIFADANLDSAVEAIVASSLATAGQVCSAGTRILVEHEVYEEVCERLRVAAEGLRVGPASTDPQMGPLISRRQQERVLAGLRQARAEGARFLCGDEDLPENRLARGYFVKPTILADVSGDMHVAREELFGPALAVMDIEDERHAVEVANDTEFGLVAGVWTRDIGRAHRVARDVSAGQVFINNYGAGGGIELPFGGYRNSGIGREKGLAALHEYVQTKNVCVRIED